MVTSSIANGSASRSRCVRCCSATPAHRSRMSHPRPATGSTGPFLGRGLAIGDLDGDGRPDVAAAALDAPAALLQNISQGGHFLNLELVDRNGRPAFGAAGPGHGRRADSGRRAGCRRQLSRRFRAEGVLRARPEPRLSAASKWTGPGGHRKPGPNGNCQLAASCGSCRERGGRFPDGILQRSLTESHHANRLRGLTTMSSPSQAEPDRHTLQCMEIWGGIEPVERTVTTPGLDAWIFSQPFQGDEQGGDVYYVTLCGGGLITRIVVADVSGHGASVAEFSLALAGARPQEYQSEESKTTGPAAQPPVHGDGGDAPVCHGPGGDVPRFHESDLRLQRRSSPPLVPSSNRWRLVDALADGRRRAGPATCHWVSTKRPVTRCTMSNSAGVICSCFTPMPSSRPRIPMGVYWASRGFWRRCARSTLSDRSPAAIGTALLEAVASYREHRSADDDMTLIVIHHNAADSPRLSLAQKLDVYAKVFGLKPV